MKMSCCDCKYYGQGCIPSNPKVYRDCEQSAENNIHSFEWADKRLAAGELAMSILMMLANDMYYPKSVEKITRRALALDMMGECKRCLDELEEGEA